MSARARGSRRDGGPALLNVIYKSTIYGNVIQAGDAGELPPGFLPPPPTVPGQLPAARPGFTGRSHELSRILAALDPAAHVDAVLVSAISGMAGIGKTELAIQAGHAAIARDWFPGGVIFLDLHGYDPAREPVSESAAVEQALRAFGVAADEIPPDPAMLEERAARYRSTLAAAIGPVLVVADNARYASQIQSLRPGVARHRMMVTSRDVFSQFGAELINLDTLAEPDALALLDAALRRANPGDERITEAPRAAAQVAQLCGYLPLTLQIAAAMLAKDPGRPIAELADELHKAPSRLALLDGGHRAVIPVFEASYRGLDQRAARIFRLLTVNRGPDLSTRAVAALADQDEIDVRTVLESLADAHIIERVTTARGRWRMHDLLRDYARQVADEAAVTGEHESALGRLAEYYAELANAANRWLISSPAETDVFQTMAEALGWFEAEYPNLVAMTVHTRESGHDQAAIDLARALAAFLSGRGHVAALLAVTEAGRSAAHDLGADSDEAGLLVASSGALRTARRFRDAAAACRQAAEISARTTDPAGEATALAALGAVLIESRSFDEALAVGQRAVDILDTTGEEGFAGALALNNTALALVELDRVSDGLALFRRSVKIFQGINAAQTALALNNLGFTLVRLDEAGEAVPALREAVAISRASGLLAVQVMALSNLAAALSDIGEHAQAFATIQEARALNRSLGNRHLEAEILLGLDMIHYEGDHYEQSLAAGREAAQIYAELGDGYRQAVALRSVGQTLRRLKRFGEAAGAFTESAQSFLAERNLSEAGTALNNLGGVLRDGGARTAAAVAFLEANSLLWSAGEEAAADRALESLSTTLKKLPRSAAPEIIAAAAPLIGETSAMTDLSIPLTWLDRFDEAEALCLQAVNRSQDDGDRHMEGVAAERLSSALRGLKRYEQALDSAQRALAIALETSDLPYQASAWNKIGHCRLAMDQRDEAVAAFGTAATLYTDLGSRYHLGGSLASIGRVLANEHRWDEAAAVFHEAVAAYHDAPSRKDEAWTAISLAYSRHRAGRYDDAIEAARRAARIFDARGEYMNKGVAYNIIWRAKLRRFRRR